VDPKTPCGTGYQCFKPCAFAASFPAFGINKMGDFGFGFKFPGT
jgi:hypothetical protein